MKVGYEEWEDQDVPGYHASLSSGHYSTGFSAVIKDGLPQEPVSSLGAIGFVTRPLSRAALKRLNTPAKRRRKR